jgi:CubicO group peptidase (beta-lactamase class C family)
MQLVEQGKIGLDDPISKYYAAAPQAWSKVTIRHLLTHRSGIPSFTDLPDFLNEQVRMDRTPDELIALTRDKPLKFEPGTSYEYDNTGYVILGWVIEKVSGQSYADYLRDHLFKPLGMDHTGCDVSEEVLRHRASGYELQKDDSVRNASYLSMSLPYAAGCLHSDVDDLLVWDQALYAGKLLKPASMADMFTDHGHHYGYGWQVVEIEGRRVWRHTGSLNGFHSAIARYPDQRLTVIVLGNIFQAPVEKIAEELARVNFGEPPEPQPAPGVTHSDRPGS